MTTKEHHRRNIAHRIRQEHRKHKKMGDLEWSNIAAAKVITMIDEYTQHSAQERYDKAMKIIPRHLGTLDKREVVECIKAAAGLTT